MKNIKTKIRFALLKTMLVAIHGFQRKKTMNESFFQNHLIGIDFNLILVSIKIIIVVFYCRLMVHYHSRNHRH